MIATGVHCSSITLVDKNFDEAFRNDAAVLEMTKNPEMRGAMRVGWGAFLGRLVAAAMKSAVSVLIGVIAVAPAVLR